MGEPKNLFRKHKTSRPIKFEIEFESGEMFDNMKNSLIQNFISQIYEFSYFELELKDRTLQNFIRSDFNDPFSEKKLDSILDSIIDEIKKRDSDKINLKYQGKYNYLPSFRGSYFTINFFNLQNSKNSFIRAFRLLRTLNKLLVSKYFSIEYQIEFTNNELNIKSINLKNAGKSFLLFESSNTDSKYKIISDTLDIGTLEQSYFTNLDNFFFRDKTIFNSFDIIQKDNNNEMVLQCVLNIFLIAQENLRILFDKDKINYVSPLRALPKRYYILAKNKIIFAGIIIFFRPFPSNFII